MEVKCIRLAHGSLCVQIMPVTYTAANFLFVPGNPKRSFASRSRRDLEVKPFILIASELSGSFRIILPHGTGGSEVLKRRRGAFPPLFSLSLFRAFACRKRLSSETAYRLLFNTPRNKRINSTHCFDAAFALFAKGGGCREVMDRGCGPRGAHVPKTRRRRFVAAIFSADAAEVRVLEVEG